ncbi:hypothetical protein D3C72_1107080 [compost metagenome]
MKKMILGLASVVMVSTAQASEYPWWYMFSMTTVSPFMTSMLISYCQGSYACDDDKQIIIDAKEDAAMFVATEGAVRGVRLQKAMELVRSANPGVEVPDMVIAQDILAIQL